MTVIKEVVGTNLYLFTQLDTKFKIGDTVKLKSSSPLMTVVACDHEQVQVKWFVGDSLHGDIYPIQAVTKAKGVKIGTSLQV